MVYFLGFWTKIIDWPDALSQFSGTFMLGVIVFPKMIIFRCLTIISRACSRTAVCDPCFKENRFLKVALLMAFLLVSPQLEAQSFYTSYFGPTNQAVTGITPIITGFNNNNVVCGLYQSGENSFVYAPEATATLPHEYTNVSAPADITISYKTLYFLGNDDSDACYAIFNGQPSYNTNPPSSDVPPIAWSGSIARWKSGLLDFPFTPFSPGNDDTGRLKPGLSLPGMLGEFVIYSVVPLSVGSSGHVLANLSFSQLTRIDTPNVVGGQEVLYGTGYTRQIIFDANDGNWSFVESESTNNVLSTSAPNKYGYFVGYEMVNNGVGYLPVYKPRKWAANGTYQEYPDPGLLTNLQPNSINDEGEVAGVFGQKYQLDANGVTIRNTNAWAGIFLYLPVDAYGLSAGMHVVTNGLYGVQSVVQNNRGQLLLQYSTNPTNSIATLWNQGSFENLQPLLLGNGGWSNIYAAGLNDKGSVVGYGDGPYGSSMFMGRPWIDISVTASTNRVHIGSNIVVSVNLGNYRLSTPMTDLNLLGNLVLSPTNLASLVSGPTPPGPFTLPSGGSTNFTFELTATNDGILRVSAQVRGTNNGIRYTSFRATSEPIKIIDWGDLLVKTDYDPTNKYIGAGIYGERPLPAQTLTNLITLSNQAGFNVLIQNDDALPHQYILTGREYGNPGWTTKYLLGSTDISAGIHGVNGYTLPPLAGHSAQVITIQSVSTNHVSGDEQRADLELHSTNDPTTTIDSIEVASIVMQEIVVNTTGDEPDADPNDSVPDVDLTKPGLQTTLRCAIDFANRRQGAFHIGFKIPATDPGLMDGVPQISPASPLPVVTNTMVIDGWSQNTKALKPPMVLSGNNLPRPASPDSSSYDWPGAGSGLELQGSGSVVRGLVINQFPIGITLAGDGSHSIEGCYLGMNAAGTQALGNGEEGGAFQRELNGLYLPGDYLTNRLFPKGCDILIKSQQNRIGGNADSQHNHFGSLDGTVNNLTSFRPNATYIYYPPAIRVEGSGAFANSILGNSFGLTADESVPIAESYVSINNGRLESYRAAHEAIFITNAPGTLIGSGDPGSANVFSTAQDGIRVFGAGAFGTTIQGNYFGVRRDGTTTLPLVTGVYANGCGLLQIGGANPGEGNLFRANADYFPAGPIQILLDSLTGQSSTVQGNILGNTSKPNSISASAAMVVNLADSQVIIVSNTIADFRNFGLVVDNAGTPVPGVATLILGNTFISHHTSSLFAPGAAIQIRSGVGHTVVANQLNADPDLGLLRLLPGEQSGILSIPPLANDDFDLDSGPNTLLNWPVIGQAVLSGGQLKFQVAVDTKPYSGTYTFQIYQCLADQWGHGQPVSLITTGSGTADATGRAGFAGNIAAPQLSPGDYLCAMATGPDGSTSEEGTVALVRGGVDTDSDGVPDAVEARVSNRGAPGSIRFLAQVNGDGNGDGIQDSLQANVCSGPMAGGNWLTLVAGSGIGFSNVQFAALPPGITLPAGYSFPLGFVSFAVNSLAPGSSINITNIFHNSFTNLTVWAYGATSSNPTPHWYLIPAVPGSDFLAVTLSDGGSGDQDALANGSITTLYGFGYPIPSQLQISQFSVEPVTSIASGTNSDAFTPVVFSWPLAGGTNYEIEWTSSLSPPDWQPIMEPVTVVGTNLVVTNYNSFPTCFFRLNTGMATLAGIGQPTLNISGSTSGTMLLTWPASYMGYHLQECSDLNLAQWIDSTDFVYVLEGNRLAFFSPDGAAKYFRLSTAQ
jgi:hypothetical protein